MISNLKTTDKLIITLSLTDSLREASPDTLILFGQRLLDSLTTHLGREYIRNISMKASDSAVVSMMEMVANHLPIVVHLFVGGTTKKVPATQH